MPVTQRLMKAGQFTLRFSNPKGTSRAAYDACTPPISTHIVITPTRLLPIGGYSDANILSQALYSGVITGRPDSKTVVGQGPEWWLGTDEGLGDLLDSAVTNTSATLSTWVTSLKPASLSAGTVTNTGTSYTGTYQWMTRREALTHLCRQVGAEWRVNPNFTLDAAAPTTLFVSTPTTVITRKRQSSEGSLRGVQASELVAANDIDGYTQKVIVVGKNGDGAAVATGSATGSNVYKDPLNANVTIERFVDAPQEPAANLTAYATAMLALLGSARRPITVDSDMYAIPLTVKPGDYVWVHDPDSGTVDTANQIQWRGETVCPVKLRCQSVTWAIQKGMGVYARTSAGVYTDLSDAVEFERSGSSFELGGGANDPLQDPAQLGAAWLGVNPNIVARTSGRDWTLPWGVVARGSFTTSTASAVSSGAYIDVGPTLTFTAVAGRVYRASLSVSRAYCAAANLLLAGWHYNGAFSKWLAIQSYTAGADHQINGVIHISGLSAGSQTVKIQASSTGATAVYFQYGTYGTDMIIEDVGPA